MEAMNNMSKGDKAKALFLEGYNCAQAVAMAYAEEMGLPSNLVTKMVSGFGGGVGRMREVCGAVSGMVMVVSMLYGYDNPKPTTQKAELYSKIQTLGARFKDENGSVVCKELLQLQTKGFDLPIPEERTENYYKKRPCPELVKCAADILEDFIEKNK